MPPPWLTSETEADSLLSGVVAGVPLPWARRQGHWGLRSWTQTWSSGPASVGVSQADLGMGHPTPAHFPYLDLGAYGLPPATISFESSLEAGASIPTWTPRQDGGRRTVGAQYTWSTPMYPVCSQFLYFSVFSFFLPFFPFLCLRPGTSLALPSLLRTPREGHNLSFQRLSHQRPNLPSIPEMRAASHQPLWALGQLRLEAGQQDIYF